MFTKGKGSNMVTLISAETVITGAVKTSNALEVYGIIEVPVGSVAIESPASVRVAPNASVKGDIVAGDVLVQGTITGNIKSTGQVKLAKGCTLLGDIVARSLSIDDGVNFTGGVKVEHGENSAA